MRRFYAAAARWATLPILALYFGPDSTFAASPGATDTPEKTVPQGEDPPGADNGEQQTAPLSQHNAGLRIDRGIAVDRYLERAHRAFTLRATSLDGQTAFGRKPAH
jgi:hypothetical protein